MPSQRDFNIQFSVALILGVTVFVLLRLKVRKTAGEISAGVSSLEKEIKHVNDLLQKSEQLLHDLITTLKIGIIFLDADGKVMVFNNQMEKIFGMKTDETVGHSMEELLPELEKNGFDKKAVRLVSELAEKEKEEKEFEIQKELNDEEKSYLYTVHIYRDSGTILGSAIFVEETTEKNRLTEQSQRSDKALSRTTRKLEEKVEELTKQYEVAKKGYLDTVRAFAFTLEARNQYTREHSERVTNYALDIARKMNLDSDTVELIQYAGRLHDIGKIAIKDDILTKPGGLSVTEFAEIRLHPAKGAEMLEPLGFMKESLDSIRYHHERFDGGGYPDRLAKTKIPLTARILAVADTFDAMTSDRPYRKALSVEQAVEELKKNSGTQFDPQIIQAFMQVLNSGKK
jgi:PAS domain S-box-containing protein/putative nucleotidyltransferase with HDIG domain